MTCSFTDQGYIGYRDDDGGREGTKQIYVCNRATSELTAAFTLNTEREIDAALPALRDITRYSFQSQERAVAGSSSLTF